MKIGGPEALPDTAPCSLRQGQAYTTELPTFGSGAPSVYVASDYTYLNSGGLSKFPGAAFKAKYPRRRSGQVFGSIEALVSRDEEGQSSDPDGRAIASLSYTATPGDPGDHRRQNPPGQPGFPTPALRGAERHARRQRSLQPGPGVPAPSPREQGAGPLGQPGRSSAAPKKAAMLRAAADRRLAGRRQQRGPGRRSARRHRHRLAAARSQAGPRARSGSSPARRGAWATEPTPTTCPTFPEDTGAGGQPVSASG